MVNAGGDYSGEIQPWFCSNLSNPVFMYVLTLVLINSEDIQIGSSYVNSSYQKTSRLWFEAGWEEGQLKAERAQSLK